jgi:hypothetical protein
LNVVEFGIKDRLPSACSRSFDFLALKGLPMTRQPKNVSISFNTTKEINELIERAAAREMLTKSSWVNRAILAAASTVAKELEV